MDFLLGWSCGVLMAGCFSYWQVKMANRHADNAERIAKEALEQADD